ncbi:type I polyketide synthase [Streptomyces sp. NBC_01803]|uniref:type I polyketide synthase n=1 Tax=Streptomyces sp. NBC_01803 TaxID=2975946 RepID=UPI002DD8346C|nr:SDR family NAD(P)-dependent oxidoreductase [Streptomyces sp. NBC_01803]WSA43063.1 SDR family NAD(P)-dependent oxidoreductase [Streptomyces sp. NBC_01803]
MSEPDQEDNGQVAIIGMAGRFPGAPDVETFWENLAQGREGISSFTDEELLDAGVGPDALSRDDYVRAKGVLADADRFDAAFFGYSPREAEVMDPQHRVFLECAWEALETAGVDPRTFDGRIGVFAGAGLNSYLLFNVMPNRRVVDSVGMHRVLLASDKDFLATRVSYKLDLKGPGITVQTACSTSLTAVHLACQSLLGGECDIALAGGVAVTAPLKSGYLYEKGGILSPDGHCRAFDADAAGTVAGNGAGVVVLRRLADARAGGDAVDAVIRGTAINNDGSLKAGYTAPSVDGQADVIAEALAVADIDPATVGYVETHGTGTPLGDPIEVAALTRAFREHTEDRGFCALGSVKSNVGHLDAAAGVTGLIKAVLALRHEAIPPTLHCAEPNPQLALESSPFFVNTELRRWPRTDAAPRRAGVSSFGIGGTNAHVVLEEAPAERPAAERPARPARVLPLSAKNAPALAEGARRLADHLRRHPGTDLDDVAHTLTRRRAFDHRAAVVCRDGDEAVAALSRLAGTGTGTGPGTGTGTGTGSAAVSVAPDRAAPVAFLFPGQGAQHVGMARGLHATEAVFARELDRCAELFTPHLGEDPRTLLFAPDDRAEEAADRLRQTRIAQPALFAVEYALARLWESWGVRPRAMAGHSVGEYVAACLAGVFTLEDAVRLVAARGRLVQEMPTGAMLSVFLPEAETTAWLGDGLVLAAVNSTALSVVSGPADAVDGLERRLTAASVACRRLHTSHAFHSPAMDGAVEPFVAEVRAVPLRAPRVPFVSNVTGTWITDEQATSPDYWGTHLRAPVRFSDALDVLLADPDLVPLEVGPGRTLTDFARRHRAWTATRTAADSLPHPRERTDDTAHLLTGLGTLWSAGAAVDWTAVHGGERRRPLRLPTYAFQRQRYWVEADDESPREERPRAARPPAEWFATPGWKRLPVPAAPAAAPGAGALWVVLGADLALGGALARSLAADGAAVVRVGAGPDLVQDGDRAWTLDPADRDHLATLVKSLDAAAPETIRVVHLWSTADGPGADGPTPERLDAARRLGFDSLLALAQGIADARPSVPVAVDVLCRGVHSVTGEEPLQPENATLLGATTVIPQEIPDTACRALDITGLDPDAPRDDQVRAVRAVLAHPTEEPQLALRGRHGWIRDFDTVPLPAPAGPDAGPDAGADAGAAGRTGLRDGGGYVITGGLGGIGLALAEHIARTVEAPVLGLLGRSAFPTEETWDAWLRDHGEQDPTSVRIRRLRHLAELGARTLVLRADVTDPEETARAIAQVRDTAGALHGVVHAAGLPSRGMIPTKSRADADQVLAAKTRGTLVLDRVCRDDDLDFLLLCSSVTAVLGGPGQSDYGAANAFLDAFAQWKRRAGGTPVTAVAWDTWREVGMAAGLLARLGGAADADADAGEELTGHPLLTRLVHRTEESRTYASTFSTAESWIVDDHRIMGHGLIPGTAYLELVRAAVAEQAAGRVIEIHDVLYMTPVIVPDGQTREVFTTVELRDGQWRFAVQSRTGGAGSTVWRDHARGSVTFHEPEPDTVHDLDALIARCEITDVLDTDDAIERGLGLDRFQSGGPIEFSFGPRWKCMREIRVGARRVFATLRLDDAHAADVDSYLLHPALFDAAGGTARVHARDTYYLPFSYRSLRIAHGLTSTIHCYVELKESADSSGEIMSCDIDILDPEGRSLVRVTDFAIKRINDLTGLREQIERSSVPPPDEAHDRGPADTERDGHGPDAAPGILRTLSEGISEEEGRGAFARILAAPEPPDQLVVSHHDFTAMRRLARTITPALLAREAERFAPPAGSHPRPDLATPYVAPVTDEEKAVAAVWQEILGVEQVGVDDDFFALGGHSLAAVQIGTRIRARFGIELDLRRFFDAPTVAHTVTLLADGDRERTPEDTIEAISRDEPYPDPADPADPADPDGLAELSDEEVEAQLRELLAAETGEQRTGEQEGMA